VISRQTQLSIGKRLCVVYYTQRKFSKVWKTLKSLRVTHLRWSPFIISAGVVLVSPYLSQVIQGNSALQLSGVAKSSTG